MVKTLPNAQSASVIVPDTAPLTEAFPADARHWHERRPVRLALMAVPFLLILAMWQLLAVRNIEALAYAIPTPADTFAQLGADITSRLIYDAIAITMLEFALGLAIGATLGILVGAPLGLVRAVHDIVWPTVVFFQAIPKIALAPLMVIIFGFGIGSKVALAASISFFPILVGVINGVRSVRSEELDLMSSLNSSRWQQFVTIRVPRALPSTFGGFQVGAIFALMAAVVTEFLGATAGLGYLIQLRSTQLQTAGVFSVLFILSVIGVSVSLLLSAVANRLSRWEE